MNPEIPRRGAEEVLQRYRRQIKASEYVWRLPPHRDPPLPVKILIIHRELLCLSRAHLPVINRLQEPLPLPCYLPVHGTSTTSFHLLPSHPVGWLLVWSCPYGRQRVGGGGAIHANNRSKWETICLLNQETWMHSRRQILYRTLLKARQLTSSHRPPAFSLRLPIFLFLLQTSHLPAAALTNFNNKGQAFAKALWQTNQGRNGSNRETKRTKSQKWIWLCIQLHV